MITREERRRIHLISQIARSGKRPARVAVAHASDAHAAWSRTAKTGAVVALAAASALAASQVMGQVTLGLSGWLEWVLPRVY